MPDSSFWPINRMWGIHDFSMESAQEGEKFMKTIENNFGNIKDSKVWSQYAQWISYQGYRAILEAQGKNRMGVLFWMTHPAWPSFVFQTYDYYFEPTGSYFGSKKGSEPLHIQWNAFTDSIEVVNYSIPDGSNLTATVELINLDGLVKMRKQFMVDCWIDQIQRIYKLEKPEELSSTYFIRLKLEKGNQLISENFYWNGLKEETYQEIAAITKVRLDVKTKLVRKNDKWFLSTELINKTKNPAIMVQLTVVGAKKRERILPVLFSDNYVSIMPGEKRVVSAEMDAADTRGEKPEIIIEGVNVE